MSALIGRNKWQPSNMARIRYLQYRYPSFVKLLPAEVGKRLTPTNDTTIGIPDEVKIILQKTKLDWADIVDCIKMIPPQPPVPPVLQPRQLPREPEKKTAKLPAILQDIVDSPPCKQSDYSKRKHAVFKARGKFREKDMYPRYSACTGRTVVHKQPTKRWDLQTSEGVKYTLKGRADGIDNKNVVLEFKNRMSRFMVPPPVYDVDQLCIYANMFGLPCRMVEQLNGVLNVGDVIPLKCMQQHWESQLRDKVEDFVHTIAEVQSLI